MISISMSLIFYTVFSVRRKRFTPLGIGRRTDALTTFPPACAFPRVFRAVAEGFMDMIGDFPFSASFRVNGERASVVYESRDGAMTLYKVDKPGEELEIPRYDPYREETEYFADCVRSKKETALIPGTDVISVLELLDAVKESLVSGKAVRLSRILEDKEGACLRQGLPLRDGAPDAPLRRDQAWRTTRPSARDCFTSMTL